MAYLDMKLGHRQKFQKLNIHCLWSLGVENELNIFALQPAVSEIWADFWNLPYYIYVRHKAWSLTKDPDVAHVLAFYPQGVEIELIFTLQAVVSEIWGDFQNYRIYLGMTLHWQKIQKLHIYPFLPAGGQNWAHFCSTGSGFWDVGQFSKLPYLGMKLTRLLTKDPEVAHILTFYPWGLKLSLQAVVLRYRLIFKIAIFGRKTYVYHYYILSK